MDEWIDGMDEGIDAWMDGYLPGIRVLSISDGNMSNATLTIVKQELI